ncbi:MAG: FliG C-terminal domain-containing protein [Hydrogenovibrio sp.]|uniref:FliG C-terminal domain-containing protein n=1 Tax=Hydrogenovibrio sp. TaxID=2065821 RepID=UPI0028702E63|nr:FliG C-terminal domain-containing protein [Hydrogenovibrio sp.]MDR9497992.1 FliG C-terminal domain-containing protein [Hydrogenovibrio sp.]
MEVNAKRLESGEYTLDMGPVSLTLEEPVLEQLYEVIHQRLQRSGQQEAVGLNKKLQAYRTLAKKLVTVNDRILQALLPQLTPEQMVTMVRLSGPEMFDKVKRNLSRQNGQQFEEDHHDLNKITVHQAILYMEQIMPLIKRAAQEQKQRQST